jgi:glycolate oxidase FAD binding subunit
LPHASEPGSVEEAAELLRRAAAEGRRVSIDRDGGDIVLSTRRLDGVLEHEAGDLTATVEAGILLSVLNDRLAEHGQMLALDPPGDPSVGACLAGNLFGPRRHRYGAPRDLVLGVTLVLGDGTVVHSGGKVVKNVAGYDLGKLFCGSHGSLGLIARASLRLHPLPAAARTVVAPAPTPEEAERLAQALHRSALVPSAVDLLWPGRLAALFEGNERAVAEQLQQACALLAGTEDDGSVWEEVAERQAQSRGRISFAPGELAATLEGLDAAVVRAAAGVAYVRDPVPDPRPQALLSLNERIRAELDPVGVLA